MRESANCGCCVPEVADLCLGLGKRTGSAYFVLGSCRRVAPALDDDVAEWVGGQMVIHFLIRFDCSLQR